MRPGRLLGPGFVGVDSTRGRRSAFILVRLWLVLQADVIQQILDFALDALLEFGSSWLFHGQAVRWRRGNAGFCLGGEFLGTLSLDFQQTLSLIG